MNDIRIKVRRQDSPVDRPYWDEFSIPYAPNLNVISVLMEVRRNPVNIKGDKVAPIVWDCNCLEEVCGACSMVINGKARQACTALIDNLTQPVVLEPLSKFPVIRDLVVDRTRMFNALKRVKAWVPIDGTYDLGPGPRQSSKNQQFTYAISRCMTCGCCLEACPQVSIDNLFVGPSALGQAVLFNMHPTGAANSHERLDSLMGDGGLADCGNAQNCVRVCPKEVPLTEAIADLNRQAVKYAFERWFGVGENRA